MRKRSKPHTFEQRLEEFRLRLEEELAQTPQGTQRDAVVARIDQLRTAAEMHAMLSRQASRVPAGGIGAGDVRTMAADA